ncbi:response regulator transcription factor [Mesobacillus subterraneus]|uniref:response regulator transcription factor n=1 Tax=Mesobacillus subterraneus TaxID=285983 RepID=UPI00203C61F5|nr:response regulator transcription factor [Mesobacillus subterraneus]MCM3683007.1 response regulator transcription factor [Mesobacillus subterraneus]
MKRILLAEDDEILRMLIVDTLEDEDCQVDEAVDGLEALGLLQEGQYDLVIIDYMMPAYSGLEVIEQVRQEGINTNVAILMLSAKSQLSEQEKAIGAGADYFIAKPFSPLELLDKVRDILDEKNKIQ